MTDELTKAQVRVLRFLAAYPDWHHLIELELLSLLHDDDVLCVPSLIELGLVDHRVALRAVRATPAGIVVAVERQAHD